MPLSQAVTEAIYTAYNVDQPMEATLKGAYTLLCYGYVDNARQTVERLKEEDPFDKRVIRLERSCERARIYDKDSLERLNGAHDVSVDGLAAPIEVRPPTDVMIVRAGQVKQALIAFGGASEAFWLTPEFLEMSNCHLVVLRDARRLFHLAGVEGLGADYEECVEGLKTIVADLGATKVFMIGSSSGGYAALRYALDFAGVRGVLAISPMTGHPDIAEEAPKHPGFRPLLRTKPEMLVDLLPLYEQHPNPPKVTLVWGEKHAADNEQATRMGALPNVTLEPLHGVSHHPVLVKLITRPDFDLVKRLLAT
ncbi:MAG TPA: alpha/beta hydrolase [Acetobacteraceae bacterium]|jgi:hypothetical protein|nr:alpha/beta hydrolase [Acetobacteraceae bacterium]